MNLPALTQQPDLPDSAVLVLNVGSSSIKFAIYQLRDVKHLLSGKVEHIGRHNCTLTIIDSDGKSLQKPLTNIPANAGNNAAINFILRMLEQQPCYKFISAIGHRVVQGMHHPAPARITKKIVNELKDVADSDPEHMPLILEAIEALLQQYPDVPQFACFDTSFHQTLPTVAKMLPLPRRYFDMGVQRYGFHGLSYCYLLEALDRLGDPHAYKGRVILAHLGNGASMAAILDGKSIDTSMGFTPTGGLLMGNRAGDLDAGLLAYLAQNKQQFIRRSPVSRQQSAEPLSIEQLQRMLNHESGLIGISETSSDMQDLLAHEASDNRAADAIALFCYQAKKMIGAYTAALGGLDTLVFAGGIGEKAPFIRARICSNMAFFGIELDHNSNTQNATLISTASSSVKIYVIPTNEEYMIARLVADTLLLPTH